MAGEWTPFTDNELQQLNEAFWDQEIHWIAKKAELSCPRCGGQATVLLSGNVGYPRSLNAHCRVCSRSGSFKSVDEKGEDFSEEEIQQIVTSHQGGRLSACPRCSTIVSVREVQGIGGHLTYKPHCTRCGARGELKWR